MVSLPGNYFPSMGKLICLMGKSTNHNCSYVPTTALTSGTETLLTILPLLLNPTGEELHKAREGSRQLSQQSVGFARHWIGPLTLISIEHAHSSTTTLHRQAGAEMCKEWPAPSRPASLTSTTLNSLENPTYQT